MGRTAGGRDAGRTAGRDHRWRGRRSTTDRHPSGASQLRPIHRGRADRVGGRDRRGRRMSERRLLAIDTSGTSALVALGETDGSLISESRWLAGYRHGEELLTRIDEMLTTTGTPKAEIGGIVVGTGPGAFTGLRVGLATAKALARGLGVPIAGVPASEALLEAASLAGALEGTQAV